MRLLRRVRSLVGFLVTHTASALKLFGHVLIWSLMTSALLVLAAVEGVSEAVLAWLKRHRRLVPVIISLVAGILAMAPSVFLGMGSFAAFQLSLGLTSLVFAVMAFVFLAMRRRMMTLGRTFTMFGLALIDWFMGLALFSFSFALVFGVTLLYTVQTGIRPPLWLSNVMRTGADGFGVFVVLSSLAVYYEMRRAGDAVRVHTDQWDQKTERRRHRRRATDRPAERAD